MKIKNAQDFWAGVMFVGIGIFFVVVSMGTPEFINQLWGDKLIGGYQMGTAVRMGPAYFPVVLGGILAVLGGIVLFRAFVSKDVEHSAVKIPFNIVDLLIAVGIFVVFTYVAKGLNISNDYAMLVSAAVLSFLSWKYRPETRALVLILASSLAFAYLLKPLGLIVSAAALVFISAFGGHEFKWKEVALMSVALVIFSVVVFVKGLTLPFPICPAFIESCPIR
jgi:hypothetical protein